MPIDQKRSRLTFRKLDRELAKLANKPKPESVHKFRTHSRRVEALLNEVSLEHHRNDEKLLRLLERLRKKAGRVRDLDVQIRLLRALKFPEGNGHKAQVLEALVEERTTREKKLAKAFDQDTADEIRRRLKRSVNEMKIPNGTGAPALALRNLDELAQSRAPLTEKTLHQYRIAGKRARYIAELAEDDAEAAGIVEQLKRMQNVVGDWHDWLKLTQKAEALLGSVRESALVAMLRNVTQAKFRQSVDAVATLREWLVDRAHRHAAEAVRARKPAAEPSRQTAAA